ncbi:hypothetical protein, unknown function [Leishmania tarentolae]|uniref:Cysteine peptidase B (CPB) n=1 Tax=Leishmania tarentolae TaxID=5689 RepID=A0A640K8Q4_LEITA|nr:hypothetical protein, unknown function [Leishmania tarentolae]
MPYVSVRADPSGEDQIFVLRILSLTSRRAAAVKNRAEAVVVPTTPPGLAKTRSHFPLGASCVSSGTGGKVSGRASFTRPADGRDKDGEGALVRGTSPLAASVSGDTATVLHSHASDPLHAPDACLEHERGVGSAETSLPASATSRGVKEALTNAADSPTSPPLATSSMSSVRRAMEKGARPMRRPRNTFASSPSAHARSDSNGDLSEAAKAAAWRRDAVRRTLSLLGLSTSAGVSVGVDRCEGAASSSSQVPEDETAVDEQALTTTVSQCSAEGSPGSAPAPEVSRRAVLSAPAMPVENTQGKIDTRFPDSPAVVNTFAAFLQLMQPAPSPPSLTVPRPGSTTTSAAPCSTVQDSVADNIQSSFRMPSPPPPPPLLPYTETLAPQAAFGAGSFTTPQHLVARVRLLLPWTVIAVKRRRRMVGGVDEVANDFTLPLLSSSLLPIPAASECATSANSPSFAQPLQRRVLSTDSAVTPDRSCFTDDEVVLVSDRVDAVLPTWAYLSSHIADVTTSTLLLSVPSAALAGDNSTMTSTGSSRQRRSQSPPSSMASSVVSGVPPPLLSITAAPLVVDELVERQSCLYPYELAEACALARLRRRKSKTAAATPSAQSSLHLLRLELQVDVQHVLPTVGNVAPAKRQCILDQALAEFTLTGVVPTTVLRGVLNDAALRLLASVDDDVLLRIAGEVDQASHLEIEPHDSGTASISAVPTVTAQACCQRVVPLSLHVHTLQREPGVAAGAMAGPLLSSTSVHSATASTISGETDSPHRMPTGATTTPTRLILMMLVHVQQNATTLTAPVAYETPMADDEQRSQPNGQDRDGASVTVEASSSSSSAPDATTRVDEHVAVALASTAVLHLFPPTFGLSRFTTRLSLSSAVDYDVLCTATRASDVGNLPIPTAETAEETAAASERTSGRQAAEFREDATATTTGEGTRVTGAEAAMKPWSWQDISVDSVRAWCGLPELKPPPTPAATESFSSTPSVLSRVVPPVAGGAGGTARMSTLSTFQPVSKLPESLDKTSPEAAAAAVPEGEAVRDIAADQVVGLEREGKAQLSEEGRKEGELDDSGAISETLRRCDVGKETAMLTGVVEAVYRCVDTLCRHARSLQALTEVGEAGANEVVKGAVDYWGAESEGKPQTEASADQQCIVSFEETGYTPNTDATHDRRPIDDHAHLHNIMLATQQVLVYGLKRLLITGLFASECTDESEIPDFAESEAACDAKKRSACCRSLFSSMRANAQDSDESAVPHTCGIAQQLRRWFSMYGRYLAERLCAPLEQLETFITETTSSAAMTPKTATTTLSVLDKGNKSLSDVPSTSRRVVLGAQVAVKETRRHRRHIAGVKAAQNSAKCNGTGKAEEEDAYAVDPSVLPALPIAKATVQLCRTMAGTSGSYNDADVAASWKESSSHQHTPTASTDDGGLATVLNTTSLTQLHFRQHYRSTSQSLSASMRMVGATAGAVHPLHERVAPLINTITSVLRLFEAEERRWAALQEPLECLRGHWWDMRVIINEERVQWCELRQSSLVSLERQMRGALAMEEARGWSSIVAEEVIGAASTAALAAKGEPVSAESSELAKLTIPGSQPRTSSQRSVAQQPTLTPVATLTLLPGLGDAPLLPTQFLEVPQRTVMMAEECKGGRAMGDSSERVEVSGKETLLSPSLPTPLHASDVVRDAPEEAEEVEWKHASVGDAAMAEDGETAESGSDGMEASTKRRGNRLTAPTEAAAPPLLCPLSVATSSHLCTTPAHQQTAQRHQAKMKDRVKRSGQAPVMKPHPQHQSRSRAAGSPAQASKRGATSPTSLQHARASTAASNGSARPLQQRGTASTELGAGGAAPVEGALALVMRQVQQRSTPAPLNMDVVVLRQATPFVAVGAVLFFLLLFL